MTVETSLEKLYTFLVEFWSSLHHSLEIYLFISSWTLTGLLLDNLICSRSCVIRMTNMLPDLKLVLMTTDQIIVLTCRNTSNPISTNWGTLMMTTDTNKVCFLWIELFYFCSFCNCICLKRTPSLQEKVSGRLKEMSLLLRFYPDYKIYCFYQYTKASSLWERTIFLIWLK